MTEVASADPAAPTADGALWAVSDLHVSHPENWDLVRTIRARSPQDWLIVAGDVGDTPEQLQRCLGLLRERFGTVVWVPGNHELWTTPRDPVSLRGVARYDALVDLCRALDVRTPEDPAPVWRGAGGPARVVPLFLLYDYSFLAPGTTTPAASLARAHETGIVCSDEYLLHPDPYPDRAAWCAARVAEAERQLAGYDDGIPLVLVNHWPLVREPTGILRYPEFAQWCGTERTADWHRRFDVAAVVYGHLHIPRPTRYDGVPFEEVSIGYPREWRAHGLRPGLLRRILPPAEDVGRPVR